MELGDPVPGWAPRPRPERKSFRGHHAELVPFDRSHGPELFKAFSLSEENWAYLPYGPFDRYETFETWMHATLLGGDPLFFTWMKDGAPAGIGSLMRIVPEHGVIETGHLHFSPLIQRTPATTEGLYMLMTYAFEALGYRRFEWKCNALNIPSRRAAERLGFTFEGIHRQANVFKGRSRDTAWYSILDGEWPALKTGFEAWLSPDNFEEGGAQITRLHQN